MGSQASQRTPAFMTRPGIGPTFHESVQVQHKVVGEGVGRKLLSSTVSPSGPTVEYCAKLRRLGRRRWCDRRHWRDRLSIGSPPGPVYARKFLVLEVKAEL